jgi:hypothetical protein
MLDIETWGTGPRCVIVSLATAWFDELNIKSGSYIVLDAQKQIDLGRTVDADTLGFWFRLAKSAPLVVDRWNGAKKNDDDLVKVIGDIQLAKCVWANSPSFDLVAFKTLLQDLAGTAPNIYRKERDVRTVKKMVDARTISTIDVEYMAGEHDPMVDCFKQAKYVQAFWKQFGITGE